MIRLGEFETVLIRLCKLRLANFPQNYKPQNICLMPAIIVLPKTIDCCGWQNLLLIREIKCHAEHI